MALPVAPLGQLPNMNMPYSRPYYEKTSVLDKALAAFLTGLAANTGGQLAENVMQRDFAQDPAGFWSKLTQGPKQTRQQFEAETGRKAEAQSQAERIAAQERIAEADRFGAESRLARQLADRESERGVERTMFDIKGQRDREAMMYEAEQRRRLAEAAQSGQLRNIMTEYGLKDWLAGQNQPRELEQIRATGAAKKMGFMPWATQQPQGQTQAAAPTQPSALRQMVSNPKMGIPGVGPALAAIDTFVRPAPTPAASAATPTAADLAAIKAQQSIRPITIEEARAMGLPEEYIRQLFPTATDTLLDIVNPRDPNVRSPEGSGQRR